MLIQNLFLDTILKIYKIKQVSAEPRKCTMSCQIAHVKSVCRHITSIDPGDLSWKEKFFSAKAAVNAVRTLRAVTEEMCKYMAGIP